MSKKLQAAWRTSVHEAGHAVIGRVLTLACGPASIVPDDNSRGHAITADPYETLSQWERRGKVRFTPHPAMVGRVGQRPINGRKWLKF